MERAEVPPARYVYIRHTARARPGAFPMSLTRFERARVIGARALQLSMGAPPLLSESAGGVDSMEIAIREFESGRLPITVSRAADAVH